MNELKNNAHQNKYLPMQGLKELREVVAKYTSIKKGYNYKFEKCDHWTWFKRANVFAPNYF